MKPYQYVVLRCVPRVEREEFVNVGVVLFCQAEEFLDVGWHVEPSRLNALDPDVDVDAVCDAMDFIAAVCRADEAAGSVSSKDRGTRSRRARPSAYRSARGVGRRRSEA